MSPTGGPQEEWNMAESLSPRSAGKHGGRFLRPRFSSQLSRFIERPPAEVMARIRRAPSWPWS